MVIGYILFFSLVWLAYEALKPRVMNPRKIFILPLIFVVWSIWGLIARFGGIVDLLVWAVFILIGYAVGTGLTKPVKVRADKQKGFIGLPGSPIPLIVVSLFFGVILFLGYFPEMDQKTLRTLRLITESVVAGLFVGQMISISKKYVKAKHEKLRKK